MTENGIAVIGAGMIGAAHASGYRAYAPRVPSLNARLAVVCDTNEEMASKLARDWGFEAMSRSWEEVVADPSISIVSVCLPNFLHPIVSQAALRAGKHVLCEKPLSSNLSDAKATRDTAKSVDVCAGTVFNYRRIPAVADIRQRIQSGELGAPIHILVRFLCDYAADPNLPHTWRYEFAKAGPGALLDLGTHAVDLARFLFGDVSEVIGASSNIVIKERFLPATATVGHGSVTLSDKTAVVDNDDEVTALLRFANGASGVMSASRVAVGTGNRVQVEVFGTKGTARFSTEMPSHFDLAVLNGTNPASFQRVINRPSSPYVGELTAVPHDQVSVGYAEIFGFMIHEFLSSIANNAPFDNGSMEDGYRAAQVLDAIQRSIETNSPQALAE